MNRRIAQLVDRPRLARMGVAAYSTARFASEKFRLGVENRGGDNRYVDDGLPWPPDRLIFLVSGTVNRHWYQQSGAWDAQEIEESLSRNGLTIEDAGPILDFGCGSGRIIRRFATFAEAADFHAVDYNHKLISWCRDNLRFATFASNGLMPPLPYQDGQFGFVYAYSVFTHLPDDAQVAWRDELHRVIRPGGHLWLTILNDTCRDKLAPPELKRYDAGDLVIRFGGAAGANQCAAYPPEPYLNRLFSPDTGWRLVERQRSGPPWLPSAIQDFLLLERR